MQKNILVTGGAGYIGSACVDSLIKAGHQVTVFDNFSTGQRDKIHHEAILVEGDITDQEVVHSVCEANSFDLVIHLAAKKSVAESENDPILYFKNNVTGTLSLLTAMSENNIPHIIFSSTAAVYAPPSSENSLTEDSPLGPVSVYGSSKILAEHLIREFKRTNKISQYTILRYFNVAGDTGLGYIEQDAQNIFPILKNALLTESPFNIFGTDYNTRDGTCVRDYIHLSDLVDVHLASLEAKSSEIYNIGTGAGYTVRELASVFEEVSGNSLQIIESPRRLGDVAVVTASSEKAKTQLGWRPTKTLEDMVRSTLGI